MTEKKEQRVLVRAEWLAMLIREHNQQHEDLATAYAALRSIRVITRAKGAVGRIVRATLWQMELGAANYEEEPPFTKEECRRLLREGLTSEDYARLARDFDKEMGGEEWDT